MIILTQDLIFLSQKIIKKIRRSDDLNGFTYDRNNIWKKNKSVKLRFINRAKFMTYEWS